MMHQELAPRVNRTQQQMFALIKEQQSGTMTVKEFCEVNKISEARYYYWRKKYQDNTRSVNEPHPIVLACCNSVKKNDTVVCLPNIRA